MVEASRAEGLGLLWQTEFCGQWCLSRAWGWPSVSWLVLGGLNPISRPGPPIARPSLSIRPPSPVGDWAPWERVNAERVTAADAAGAGDRRPLSRRGAGAPGWVDDGASATEDGGWRANPQKDDLRGQGGEAAEAARLRSLTCAPLFSGSLATRGGGGSACWRCFRRQGWAAGLAARRYALGPVAKPAAWQARPLVSEAGMPTGQAFCRRALEHTAKPATSQKRPAPDAAGLEAGCVRRRALGACNPLPWTAAPGKGEPKLGRLLLLGLSRGWWLSIDLSLRWRSGAPGEAA